MATSPAKPAKTFLHIHVAEHPIPGVDLILGRISLPLDSPIAIEGARALIAAGDRIDAIPGDGMIEADIKVRVPINLAFIHTEVGISATAVVSVGP